MKSQVLVLNYRSVLLVVLVSLLLSFGFSHYAHADTSADEAQQVTDLMAKIQLMIAKLKGDNGVMKPSTTNSVTKRPGYGFGRSLSRGSKDGNAGDVSKLQRCLAKTGDYTYNEFTGYYGTATEDAVKSFQRKNNIVSSGDSVSTGYGAFGPKTQKMISEQCEKLIEAKEVKDLKKAENIDVEAAAKEEFNEAKKNRSAEALELFIKQHADNTLADEAKKLLSCPDCTTPLPKPNLKACSNKGKEYKDGDKLSSSRLVVGGKLMTSADGYFLCENGKWLGKDNKSSEDVAPVAPVGYSQGSYYSNSSTETEKKETAEDSSATKVDETVSEPVTCKTDNWFSYYRCKAQSNISDYKTLRNSYESSRQSRFGSEGNTSAYGGSNVRGASTSNVIEQLKEIVTRLEYLSS